MRRTNIIAKIASDTKGLLEHSASLLAVGRLQKDDSRFSRARWKKKKRLAEAKKKCLALTGFSYSLVLA